MVAHPAIRASLSFRGGSILFGLYAAIAMVGVIGITSVNVLKGPVRTMADVTKRTVAENQMLASGKLALIVSARETGDCDKDGMVEPVEWRDPSGGLAPANGGLLPSSVGAALQDPWGNNYGYCAWDVGPENDHADCGIGPRRLAGGAAMDNMVIAIISSGPDRQFQTACQPIEDGESIVRAPGGDDLVLSYSFAEALALSGGLWNLKQDDHETATIAKNLSVTDADGQEQLTFNAADRELSLGVGGTGELPNIRTDYIQNLSANVPVEFLSAIKAGPATITAEEENAVAAIVTASGDDAIGLRASGTSKAIEAEGIIDMTGNKIVNLAGPVDDQDAATKKYVDDRFVEEKTVKCEAFVFSGCTGGATQNLDTSSLGDCKKACEDAGVSCCRAQYGTLASNPNAALSECRGYATGKPTSSLVDLLASLLFPAYIGAYCYEQY